MAREIMDPKIRAIMEQMNKQNEPEVKEERKKTKSPPPPHTVSEFMLAEKLEEWPERLTSESSLDMSHGLGIIGDQATIKEILKQSTPIDLKALTDLEARLDAFDELLHKYGYMILDNPEERMEAITAAYETDNLPISVNKAFLTEMAESDAVKAHPARKRKATNLKDSIAESRKRKVEHCSFPGFRVGELTELPTQIEAPHILHRVTKAQDFNRGFRKFWKKIFLSEASVAVMQDTFWWIFLDKFAKNQYEVEMSYLFDRIADSFVALFFSVNPEIKDKIFHVYSDCLSQAIYAAYYEAFPESLRIFSDDFKQYICNLIYLWVTGSRPQLNAYKHWNLNRMMPKQLRLSDDPKAKAARDLTMGTELALNYKLDMDDFNKTVEQLGEQPTMPGFSKVSMAANRAMSRDATRLTHLTGAASKMSNGVSGARNVSPPRVAQCGSSKKPVRESHVIGPGPELERVRFDLMGRSPLVAHFLHMRELRDAAFRGRTVNRTQISRLPQKDLPTYRELIKETLTAQDALSKEYQKVCEQTNHEIMRIEKQQRATNRKIEKLQDKLMLCKNSIEVKVMRENIMDKQAFDAAQKHIKPSDDEGKDTSMNKSFGSHR